ncbi:MAG: PHP domain-containing protein [Vicinamibacterales bacterium]|nr:PHP domain-containing protein [Vicinamibacterales bacterium]
MIDLHLHTTASDGQCTPAELVSAASAAGLTCMAVTDHDTVAACAEVAALAAACGITTVSGIEITAVDEARDVHILAYGIRIEDADLQRFLDRQLTTRRERTGRVGRRLARLGVPIDVDAVLASVPHGRSVGRPHVARALVAAGHARSVTDAFDRWLGVGRPAFVPREGAPVAEVVAVVSRAGGIASLAHPGKARMDDRLVAFVESGLPAIEVFHPDHTLEARDRYQRFATAHGLLVTGGSDFHGDPEHGRSPGCCSLPPAAWQALQSRLATPTS